MAVDQGDGDLAREILFRQRQRRRAGGDDHPGDVIAQQLFKRGASCCGSSAFISSGIKPLSAS
ncbi:hypothetical protein KPZU09_30700 [Klebsiella pneumoniae]|uniref:Uncharacterized protein n=1 Tax=Klebsiella pneumoniae TaxID=573 RepID=A0A919HRH2_KLEPN|nr:hypothetical protein KPZU09_30700 [Klebsiella pneumoniae]